MIRWIGVACIALCVSAALAASEQAQNQKPTTQLPTEKDLLASYCIAVIRQQRSSYPETYHSRRADQLRQEELLKLSARLQRLEDYLDPRQPYLDLDSLVRAAEHGQVDAKSIPEEVGKCTKQCTDKPSEQGYACLQACTATNELLTRTSRCNDVNWLPY